MAGNNHVYSKLSESSLNIYWIKQPDDYLEQKFKFDLPPTYWPNGTPQGP